MVNFIVGLITIVVFYKVGKGIYEILHDIDIFKRKRE